MVVSYYQNFYMRKIIMFLLIFFSTCVVYAQSNNASQIVGIWMTEKGDSKIEIYEQNGVFFGKIIWTLPQFEKYVGKDVMKDVTYNDTQNSYSCPWICSPRLNITAHAVITVNGDILKAKVTKGIIVTHQIFTRLK